LKLAAKLKEDVFVCVAGVVSQSSSSPADPQLSGVQLQGPEDTAMQVNGETELLCQVYVTDTGSDGSVGTEHTPVKLPYNVTWYFQPHNSSDSMVSAALCMRMSATDKKKNVEY
jgi:hypothetical protein